MPGVHEDRLSDMGRPVPGFANQGKMALVQGAHGRDQCQRPVGAQRFERTAQWIQPSHGLHGRIPLARKALAPP